MSRETQLGSSLHLQDVINVARKKQHVTLPDGVRENIQKNRSVIDELIAQPDARAVYGVNTGFGALAEIRISAENIETLQQNLVRSHAAGVGVELPVEVVRAMMLLRAQTLSLAHSGCRAEVVDMLLAMLAHEIHPCIPSQGSVGASGDLAPLAHLALALLGEGEVTMGERRLSAQAALAQKGIAPLRLQAKEGLSLINGTQLMTAQGALALADARELAVVADIAGALSLETLLGTPVAFDARIHNLRPHPGQSLSAQNLRLLTQHSPLVESHKGCGKVQDPYSLRCMPQVHGAARDAIEHAVLVIERELSSVTDNPLVFVDESGWQTISGGNFHGQPIAMVLDYAKLAMQSIASIAERRIEQLMNPKLSSGLPPFVTTESGLNSGLMMAHVTAAALVSESKVLCHPASADSIPTSAAREDHVSMGPIAARHFAQIVQHTAAVLAIELLSGIQAAELRAPVLASPAGLATIACVRKYLPASAQDRVLAPEIETIRRLILSGELRAAVENVTGPLA